MKNYEINNVITFKDEIYYISEMRQMGVLVLRRAKGGEETVISKESHCVEDCEMSDWLLDNIFKRHYYNEREFFWVVACVVSYEIEVPYFKIEKCGEDGDDKCCYTFIKGNKFFYFDNVRELQNAYHFYRDYHEGDYLNEDIDEKIKKLFKLI